MDQNGNKHLTGRFLQPWIPGRQEETEGGPLGVTRFGLTATRSNFLAVPTEDSH